MRRVFLIQNAAYSIYMKGTLSAGPFIRRPHPDRIEEG
jgi:hypothetical protein